MENISRRSLLKSGAAATAAAAVAAAAPAAARADEAAAAKPEDWLGEPPALTVDDCVETVECEVLVVGSALAGSMAAYGAVKNGAKVVIIERNAAPHIGGMTISFLNSKTQLDAGLPEYDKVNVANQMFNLTQYRSDMKLNALWCNRSGEILDNMVEDFLEPYGQYYLPLSLEGIFPDPTQEINSYISTGVAFSEDTDILTDFTHNIQKFLTDQGVRYDFEVKGEVLVKDENGRVTGVIATNAAGDHVYYQASKGVVMCTGSFGGNDAMMERFYTKNFAEFAKNYNTYNCYMLDDPITDYDMDDGLGHRMLCWAGAEMEELCGYASWQTTGWRSFPYLLVDTQGNRFMNEATSLLTSAHIIADLPGHGNYVWQIIPTNDFAMPSSFGYDKETAAKVFDIETNEHYEADTIEELAEMIGVDPEVLSATVSRYNELCEAGEDTDFYKESHFLFPIKQGPFYAVEVGPGLLGVCGGIQINDDFQAVDANNQPIEGLYAIGNCAGGMYAYDYPINIQGNSHGRCLMEGKCLAEQLAGVSE